MNNEEFLSDLLYAGHMGELSESTIVEACERFGIEFPPKKYEHETNRVSSGQVSKRVWASAQNAHKPCVPNEVRQLVSMY